ncbi:MAG: deoxynucleoside kinase [Myxococcota bacterium]|jgi:deoxyadenosine/deoxycytidine kinase|nr:deoxynucleoside kinase [Myxococcota bacterium]
MVTPTLQDFPRYIIVEGPIGVGKTTLVERLANLSQGRSVLEIFEENPFLADFYEDRDRYAFQTEMFFLLSRYRQQEGLRQADLFNQVTVSDYLFVKCRLFASLTLSDHELALYDKMYNILFDQVPQPDLVIHLSAPLEILLERISKRGRPYEKAMDPEYLDRLRSLYHNFFAHYEDTPLLEIDTSDVNFAEDASAVENLVEQIKQNWRQARQAERRIEF